VPPNFDNSRANRLDGTGPNNLNQIPQLQSRNYWCVIFSAEAHLRSHSEVSRPYRPAHQNLRVGVFGGTRLTGWLIRAQRQNGTRQFFVIIKTVVDLGRKAQPNFVIVGKGGIYLDTEFIPEPFL
jgi:hypothetical protein